MEERFTKSCLRVCLDDSRYGYVRSLASHFSIDFPLQLRGIVPELGDQGAHSYLGLTTLHS